MKEVPFFDLNQLDISITELNACAPRWRNGAQTHHEHTPRTNSLLIYLLRGSWNYDVAGVRVLTIHSGDIMFLPTGCQYFSQCVTESEAEQAEAICLNFSILDEHSEELGLGQSPQLLLNDEQGKYLPLFQQALEAYLIGSGGKLTGKAIVFRLLDELAVQIRRRAFAVSVHGALYPALIQLEHHPEQNIPIPELASMCYLSPSNFRRQFHLCTGCSPVAYRNEIRIRKAEEMIRSGLYTVESAAEQLGFTDSAHFCKTFRHLRGRTPSGRK